MFKKQVENSIKILQMIPNVSLAKGMSEQELELAEKRFGIRFPLDYREFLSVCFPISSYYCFTNWRDISDKNVSYVAKLTFDNTIDGILRTIEKLGGWLPDWGEEPSLPILKLELAKQQIRKHPLFMPICGNRYLSLNPKNAGNPVYSIHQGIDVVPFGNDFWHYIEIEFGPNFDDIIDLTTLSEPIPKYNEFVSRCYSEITREFMR